MSFRRNQNTPREMVCEEVTVVALLDGSPLCLKNSRESHRELLGHSITATNKLAQELKIDSSTPSNDFKFSLAANSGRF